MDSTLTNRQFNRAQISKHDMQRCIKYLECAQLTVGRENWAVASGILSSVVVNYAGPFTGNREHLKTISKFGFLPPC